jgi:hypothetical protein
MEHHCTAYPIDDAILHTMDNELAGLVSSLAASTRMTAGEYSDTTASHYLGIPKPSYRAKTIFAHHTMLMTGRSDLSGRLARQRLEYAEKRNRCVTPMNNRAVELPNSQSHRPHARTEQP